MGSIKSRGRIASLLEVGTGFNPELTGRENIYLNGAILGMTKKEITSKLDEIIEFSGCERYIDTPTKRYSSGMTVRLAFAVAAFLEPEILVVDEVLAVGDAEFQKKAIGKMQDISREGGRTVLFVSHNMAAVKSLCTRGVLLENGKVVFVGEIEDVIARYLSNDADKETFMKYINSNNEKEKGIFKVEIKNVKPFINHDEKILIKLEFNEIISDCYIGIALLNINKVKVFTTTYYVEKKSKVLQCEIPEKLLLKGNFSIDVATFKDNNVYDYLSDVCSFQVMDLINDYKIYGGKIGDIKINCKWY
jgi:lipopolysaccharide transport system ATP-binding protein